MRHIVAWQLALAALGAVGALSVSPCRRLRYRVPTMSMSYEDKMRLVQAGLAVPGMSVEGREASRNITSTLRAAGVYELGGGSGGDGDADVRRRAAGLSPGPTLLLLAFAYTLGTRAFSSDDDAWVERLERQAERSRRRRIERLEDLGRRLAPLQDAFGWKFVASNGQPTRDAYLFLALAAAVQIALVTALAAPIQDALS
jgi:hypothetical protein